MTLPFFNLMMLALVALKMSVALVILNWIATEPEKAVATVAYSPKTRV